MLHSSMQVDNRGIVKVNDGAPAIRCAPEPDGRWTTSGRAGWPRARIASGGAAVVMPRSGVYIRSQRHTDGQLPMRQIPLMHVVPLGRTTSLAPALAVVALLGAATL